MIGKHIKSLVLYGRQRDGKEFHYRRLGMARIGKNPSPRPRRSTGKRVSACRCQTGHHLRRNRVCQADLGTVRVTYDNIRSRRPKFTGPLTAVRKLVAHPCHIRHADLTRFVLLRKSERYDALAALMGFVHRWNTRKACDGSNPRGF